LKSFTCKYPPQTVLPTSFDAAKGEDSHSAWGIAFSSLLFGFWHIGVALGSAQGSAQGNLLVALAMTMVAQGMVGLGWAIAFVRTRNLLAPSLIHVLFNVSQL
jgi:membrane protease YdiL (CAAX protease family)